MLTPTNTGLVTGLTGDPRTVGATLAPNSRGRSTMATVFDPAVWKGPPPASGDNRRGWHRWPSRQVAVPITAAQMPLNVYLPAIFAQHYGARRWRCPA